MIALPENGRQRTGAIPTPRLQEVHQLVSDAFPEAALRDRSPHAVPDEAFEWVPVVGVDGGAGMHIKTVELSLEFRILLHRRRVSVVEELLDELGKLSVLVGDVTDGEQPAAAGDGGDEVQELLAGLDGGDAHWWRIRRRAAHVDAVERQDVKRKMERQRTRRSLNERDRSGLGTRRRAGEDALQLAEPVDKDAEEPGFQRAVAGNAVVHIEG